MFNVEWFNKVFIKKDGNCMFHAINTSLNEQLTNCRRKKNGLPVNKDLSDKEDELSSALRSVVVTYMEIHEGKFSNSFQFDEEVYESIQHRIQMMKCDGEFGGELELYIISKIFKIQINVFVKNYNGFNLVSKIGKDSSKICNLLYENMHYESLILNEDYKKEFKSSLKQWAKENPKIDFEEIISSEHSDSDYEII
jgi:hypothetical protein